MTPANIRFTMAPWLAGARIASLNAQTYGTHWRIARHSGTPHTSMPMLKRSLQYASRANRIRRAAARRFGLSARAVLVAEAAYRRRLGQRCDF